MFTYICVFLVVAVVAIQLNLLDALIGAVGQLASVLLAAVSTAWGAVAIGLIVLVYLIQPVAAVPTEKPGVVQGHVQKKKAPSAPVEEI